MTEDSMTDAETTESVIQSMLTENTGRHMLDSGGAYGRNWERNQGVDFAAMPECDFRFSAREAGKYDRGHTEGALMLEIEATINLYPWLVERLEFDPEADAKFREFAESEEMADESWFTCVDEYVERIGGECEGGGAWTVNSYNGESALSQVIQYTMIDLPDDHEGPYGEDSLCFLSIHGGCDVRGGYTAPRVFRTSRYALADDVRMTLACTGDGPPLVNPGQLDLAGEPVGEQHCYAWWDSDNAGYSFTSDEHPELESFPVERGTEGKVGVIVVDEDNGRAFCPLCGSSLAVYGPGEPSY